jgi:hypothetical protein
MMRMMISGEVEQLGVKMAQGNAEGVKRALDRMCHRFRSADEIMEQAAVRWQVTV